MNSVNKNNQNLSRHIGTGPKAYPAFNGAVRRTSPELSASELRGIVIEILG